MFMHSFTGLLFNYLYDLLPAISCIHNSVIYEEKLTHNFLLLRFNYLIAKFLQNRVFGTQFMSVRRVLLTNC